MTTIERLRKWWRPPDPRFCQRCGQRLARRGAESFDEQTGQLMPRPYAICPEISASYLGEGCGGWQIRGAWPEHTFIDHEPRWEATP
uniref:Uncharacterized protein n=1 Tax=viral metagenome TaxID=1070528 RepID=A0A6M3LKR4_9ZZZZ